MGVNGAGQQLLADAGLAAHQHRDVSPSGLLDHLPDLAHLRAHQQPELPLQPVTVVLGRLPRRRLAARPRDHGPDGVLEVPGRVRPGDEVVAARLDGLHDLLAVPGIRDHDDRS